MKNIKEALIIFGIMFVCVIIIILSLVYNVIADILTIIVVILITVFFSFLGKLLVESIVSVKKEENEFERVVKETEKETEYLSLKQFCNEIINNDKRGKILKFENFIGKLPSIFIAIFLIFSFLVTPGLALISGLMDEETETQLFKGVSFVLLCAVFGIIICMIVLGITRILTKKFSNEISEKIVKKVNDKMEYNEEIPKTRKDVDVFNKFNVTRHASVRISADAYIHGYIHEKCYMELMKVCYSWTTRRVS